MIAVVLSISVPSQSKTIKSNFLRGMSKNSPR
jgi:hypothetical protein